MTSTTRLLAGVGRGERLDLTRHLEVHGPLAIPSKPDPRWSEHLQLEIERSGLRGRGGGGFPTASKLASLERRRRRPLLVINLMEGEPASRKDTLLAASAPHLILDGADAVASLLGARAIKIAIADDNEPAATSLADAIAERARRAGTVAAVELVRPNGRYIAGEESALISWLDGGPALPTFRPQKPAALRIKGAPTIVVNAESAAHVALIARHGGKWFSAVGPGGTTLVTVSGAVGAPGVLEVTPGTTIRQILDRAGVRDTPVGVVVGGFGGTIVGPSQLDEPLAIDRRMPGISPGAGIIMAISADTCPLGELARIARYMAGESAGQCGPCAFGLPAIATDLELLARGSVDHRLGERLDVRLTEVVGRGACAHPDGVARLVRAGLEVFAHDVNHHMAGRPCEPARRSSRSTAGTAKDRSWR